MAVADLIVCQVAAAAMWAVAVAKVRSWRHRGASKPCRAARHAHNLREHTVRALAPAPAVLQLENATSSRYNYTPKYRIL